MVEYQFVRAYSIQMPAAVIAQVVERRLGKAEVTGSNPVNSLSYNREINGKVSS